MLHGVWKNFFNEMWGSLSTISRFKGNGKLGMLSRGISFTIFQRSPTSHLHLVYLNHFNPANFITWRTTPLFYNANIHSSKFYYNNLSNIQWINTNKTESSRSKFNINKLVSHGFYNGLWRRWFHVAKNPLFQLETAGVVSQLLDSLHGIHNSSYRRESIRLQSLSNDKQVSSGSFIEFVIPNLTRKHLYSQESNLLNEHTLMEMESTITSMKKLYENTTKIFKSYGCLPTEKTDDGKLRIYLPNKTAIETERLVSDLGIVEGMVHEQLITNVSKYNQYQENSDGILSSSCNSSFDSNENEFIYLNRFSPVLSQISL